VPNEFALNGGIFVSTGDAAERAASTTANLATNQGPGKSVITAFTNENTAVTNITDGNAFKQPQPSYYTSAASSLTSTPDIFLGVTGGANSSSFISFDSGRTSIGYDGSNGYAVSQLASKSSIILSTNATSSQKIMSGAVSLKLNSSTATIGFSGAPLCFKGWDSVNSTTEEYIYSAASVLVATTTKPSFCQ
jgi:hypothetical protein